MPYVINTKVYLKKQIYWGYYWLISNEEKFFSTADIPWKNCFNPKLLINQIKAVAIVIILEHQYCT